MRKIVTSAALALAATAVFSVVIPGSASAINEVSCNRNDFAKISIRNASDRCYANDGRWKAGGEHHRPQDLFRQQLADLGR